MLNPNPLLASIVLVVLCNNPLFGQEKLKPMPFSDQLSDLLQQLHQEHDRVVAETVIVKESRDVTYTVRHGLFGRRCRIITETVVSEALKETTRVVDAFDGGIGWKDPSETETANVKLVLDRKSMNLGKSSDLAAIRASRIQFVCEQYLSETLRIPREQIKSKVDSRVGQIGDRHLVIGQLNFTAHPNDPTRERAFRVFASVDGEALRETHVEIQVQQRAIGLTPQQRLDDRYYDSDNLLKPAITRFLQHIYEKSTTAP